MVLTVSRSEPAPASLLLLTVMLVRQPFAAPDVAGERGGAGTVGPDEVAPRTEREAAESTAALSARRDWRRWYWLQML